MDDDALKLDSQFCFAVYSAAHAVMRAYRPLLERLGLTYPQYLVMLVLWERDGQAVGAIADRLMLESSTLTPLLKRLEGMGLATRRRNPDNERQLIVSLTPAGHQLKDEAAAIPPHILSCSGKGVTELANLREAIVGIRDSFAASRAGRGPSGGPEEGDPPAVDP
ncbi:MarR family winged helix-turn-helix transcriptional regulator [Ancylobacter oerskovii]|uniref:MarR family winged helix-turn-helix transcriptional regulator n=1 Tax=Ancylobacter oerskovii TaxID=459519 RepID=A0ABW4YYP1_9HYPH|nr:MarR family transcriptional regulator [Ancylobacter oerskovii]MBS7543554.1 MarR family transcriptional regulator [Ancylobacter oerskovii]